MLPITTLENDPTVMLHMPGIVGLTPQVWATYLCMKYNKPLPPADFAARGLVRAYINHSRWLADCPFCKVSASPVSKRDPRFWCIACGMYKNAHKPLLVAFPQEAQTIETILMMREDPTKRNWYPGETVAALAKENIAHGATKRIFA